MARQLGELLRKGYEEDEGEGFTKAFKQKELNFHLGGGADASASFHGDPAPFPVPLLERIDRLDYMIYSLEDMALPSSPRSDPSTASAPRHHRNPSTVSSSSMRQAQSLLEEVQERGTLMERVSSMELRVSKLDSSLRRILPNSSSHGFDDIHPLDKAQVDMHKHDYPEFGIVEKQEVLPFEQIKGKLDKNEGMASNWKTSTQPKGSEKKAKKYWKWLRGHFHKSC